jgi:molybdopterin-containing oxidoreductase family iron-sulfur binding subunit
VTRTGDRSYAATEPPDDRVSRRAFLRTATATGAAAAGVSLARFVRYRDEAHAQPHDGAPPNRRWVMVMDLRLCDGCEKCTEACQTMHHLPKEITWIKVYKLQSPGGQEYFMPRTCMMCDDPPCAKVCPVSATYIDREGIVLVDQNKCIGCRMCMAACPYEARYFNWRTPPPVANVLAQPSPEWPVPQQKSTVGKCVFCVHNLRVGKLPGCVEACNMEALYVGDRVRDVATNGKATVRLSQFLKDNDAVRLKEELNTHPRVYYILGHGQHLTF